MKRGEENGRGLSASEVAAASSGRCSCEEQAGRQTGELQEGKKKENPSYPDLESQVAAVEQHDVAGQGVLAHSARSPVSRPHPCLLLGPSPLDLPAREEAQHVAHSPPPSHSSKPLSPLTPLSFALSLSGPQLTRLLLKKTLLVIPHCSLPLGWQGKTDWCRQLDQSGR